MSETIFEKEKKYSFNRRNRNYKRSKKINLSHKEIDQAVLQRRRTLFDGTGCIDRIDAMQE